MADKYVAYVGSYTRGDSEGLNIMELDPDFCILKKRSVFKINNPSFLRMSNNQKYLYSTCDEGIASFRILENGDLELLGKAPVNGLRPCFLSVTKDDQYIIAAGYHDGKLTVLKINEDGSVGDVTDEIFMKGMGSVAGKNYRCHVNCAIFTPDEKYICAVDLGMDQVKVYKFNKTTGKIKLNTVIRCELESGPKHMLFSPDGKYAYITHENANYVSKYAYDAANCEFTRLQIVSTLPKKYNNYNNAVTLKLSPDGQYLYVTNSGNNSVAIYKNDPKTAEMETLCILPISGEYPRDLCLLPDGKHFLAVNQEGNSITAFDVNYKDAYFVMCSAPVKVKEPTSIAIKKL